MNDRADTGKYFDCAATTPLDERVLQAMLPYFTGDFGNPSGLYRRSRDARAAVKLAREKVAQGLNARPKEIFFTSGGTESANWALTGAAHAQAHKGRHIITTQIEHHAVLYTAQNLEKNGWEVTVLPVDAHGLVSPQAVAQALRPDTVLVSVMLANNEIGTLQPLAQIGPICREAGVLLHTDAVQAVGHIGVDVNALNVDLLTLSAHKFYGPKGVGALYVRGGTKLAPLLFGGAQEANRRAGTENVAAIVGMGEALSRAVDGLNAERARLKALRGRLLDGILREIPHVHLNGASADGEHRLPGNLNLSFAFAEGEAMLLLLDMQGFAVSTGSACTTHSLDPSHVLTAIGTPPDLINCALRFSLGKGNTEADVDALIAALAKILARLRAMSPLYDDYLKGQN
jgi:cysteine desulfurase